MDVPAPPTDLHRLAVRRLIRRARMGSLATLLPGDAGPYASLVTVASAHDGSPVLLLSRLADHTRALEQDARCCLLLEDAAGHANPQTGERVSLTARARRVTEAASVDGLRQRFLARHPAASLYAGFADFSFWRLEVERAHYVGGFARAVWLDNSFLLPPAHAACLAASEAGVLAHLNERFPEEITFLAQGMLPLEGRAGNGAWRLVALDADGCLLRQGDCDLVHSLLFEEVADGPEELEATVLRLAAAGRAQIAGQAFRRS